MAWQSYDSTSFTLSAIAPAPDFGNIFTAFSGSCVSGYEIPGWDCVGVCSRCHENYYGRSSSRISVHYHQVWLQKGGLNNHQTWIKATSLRVKFCLLVLTRS
ncbi:MAG: hypothetical protein V7L23_07570 [Nostoc sp.]|uniref:hypothetical protein n=1 Tax=Nostoc sp. TaxID=1180 RepID=UPI002FF1FBFE